MEIVFLEAASALRLTKRISSKETQPYPHVKKVNACRPITRSVKKKLISKAGI